MKDAKFFSLKATLGFTLIEMLITMTIIGILSSLVVQSYLTVGNKHKTLLAKATILNIAQNVEVYFSQKATYSGFTISKKNKSSSGFDFAIKTTKIDYKITAIPIAKGVETSLFLNSVGDKKIFNNKNLAGKYEQW
jgi:type IV pilus assembly protein PilE